MTTSNFCFASASAMPRPIPREAPVTIATFLGLFSATVKSSPAMPYAENAFRQNIPAEQERQHIHDPGERLVTHLLRDPEPEHRACEHQRHQHERLRPVHLLEHP